MDSIQNGLDVGLRLEQGSSALIPADDLGGCVVWYRQVVVPVAVRVRDERGAVGSALDRSTYGAFSLIRFLARFVLADFLTCVYLLATLVDQLRLWLVGALGLLLLAWAAALCER